MTQAEVDAVMQARKVEYDRKKKELLELHKKTERELAVLKAEFHAGNIAVEARKDRTGDHIKRDAYNLQRVLKKQLQEWKNEQLDPEQAEVQFEIFDKGIYIKAFIPLK